MELIQSKSLLAKLMANENLTIEQRNTNTAAFDVKNRILTVPVLDKNISGYLYDLFLGHEVGHALYTPLDGMMKAHEEKIPMGIMNVLEDSRIERKIKNKYPGIRSSFVRGYRELIEKDFFGTNGTDLNDMNFIDRVNLYTKGGAAQGIKFNDEERGLVNEIESTETYDDVIQLAYKVMAYMKKEKELRQVNIPEFEEDPDGDFSSEGYDDSDEFGGDDVIEKFGRPNSNTDESMDEIEDGQQQKNLAGHEGSDESGLDSHTDKSYRKNESKLFESSNKHFYYGNINDIDLKKAIVSYKQLWTEYKNDLAKYSMSGIDTNEFLKIRNDAKKVVGYLAKEFELRKNADQQKRASIAKTGELNLNKVYAYKFTEDIFKRMTVLPEGKSHGLVMFLDWSGSMSDHMENTVKQLINLVMFCKKVNIPYEVYAFTSEHSDKYHVDFKEGDLDLHGFKLMNLLSSKMSASEFTYACSALVSCAKPRAAKPHWMHLGGTPLYEGIISAMKIVPQFQKDYKLQIVNTVFLTDGDGNPVRNVMFSNLDSNGKPQRLSGYNNSDLDFGSAYGKDKVFVIRDPITKHEEKVYHSYGNELMNAYIKMLKVRTQCNIIGFYVLSGREFGRVANIFFPRSSDHAKLKSEFRKEKYKIVTNAGFDEYYLLRSEGLDTDDDTEFVVRENATTRGLVSAFSKYAGNRLSNRVVLNRFIGLIA
jgi:hypothetical protein